MKDNNYVFMNELCLQHGDELIEVNETPVDASDPTSVLILGYGLDEGEPESF
jgi:hypothetical protein